MRSIIHDLPQAIENLSEFLEKIEPYDLANDVMLPKFDIPEEFKSPEDELDNGTRGEMAYLRHITYEGAKKRYGEITDEIRERLDFRSEEHTSELQSRGHLVCSLLLEKKMIK